MGGRVSFKEYTSVRGKRWVQERIGYSFVLFCSLLLLRRIGASGGCASGCEWEAR
jgi:hypothetical protein